MKRNATLVALLLALAAVSCHKSGGKKLAAESDSLSYVIGMNVGCNLMQMDSTLNIDAVCTAIRDVYAADTKMTMDEAKTYYLRQMNYAKYEKFRQYEERFLTDLVKNDRTFVRSKTGVTYRVDKLGDQQTLAVAQRDTVVIRYKLSRPDGTVVESSYERADTTRAALSELVTGLQEVMKVVGPGGSAQAWIPSGLGYGSGGSEELGVEPNTTLFYEVEVLDVIPYRRRR